MRLLKVFQWCLAYFLTYFSISYFIDWYFDFETNIPLIVGIGGFFTIVLGVIIYSDILDLIYNFLVKRKIPKEKDPEDFFEKNNEEAKNDKEQKTNEFVQPIH